MAALLVVFRQGIEQEWFHIIIQSLMIKKQFG